MFECMECHHEFADPKKAHGGYYEETWNVCPNCGSDDIAETAECVECGAVKVKDFLTNGICSDCLRIAAEDMRTAYQYGSDRTAVVELNGVLAFALNRVQIEAILENWLMTNGDFGKECFTFALDDEDDFATWLKEEKKK